jgi:hypothetical protein
MHLIEVTIDKFGAYRWQLLGLIGFLRCQKKAHKPTYEMVGPSYLIAHISAYGAALYCNSVSSSSSKAW